MKLHYKLNSTQEVLEAYKCVRVLLFAASVQAAVPDGHQCCGVRRQLLEYTKGSVTRNKSEKKINSLLDAVSTSSDMQLLQDFYAITLAALAVRTGPKSASRALLVRFLAAPSHGHSRPHLRLPVCRRPRTSGCGSRPT